jgi:hypothetical protein
VSENRNEQGQFVSPEPATGLQSVEEAQGFREMPTPEEPQQPDSDILAEVERLQASRAQPDDPIVELRYQDASGEKLDPHLTIDLNKASTDAAKYHENQADEHRRTEDANIQRYVDGARAEALLQNPELAKDLALTETEIKAAVDAATEITPSETNEAARAHMAQQTPEQTSEADPYDGIEGLTPEAKQALRNPQVRQYLEQNSAETDQAVQAYKSAVSQANVFGQSALIAIAPELATVPVEQWGQAVQILARNDPAKGQQLSQVLNTVAAVQERQALIQHYEASQRQQQIETFAKSEDARTEQLAKSEGINVDNNKIISYWEKQGLDRSQIKQMFLNNPVAMTAEARIMMAKADRYDELMKAPRARPTPEALPVNRPGTAPTGRGNSNSIASLERQLQTATGFKAARLGAQLLAARRAANS